MTGDLSKNILSRVLATDLDGTMIPLEENLQNVCDLKTLATGIEEQQAELVYITGRHFEYGMDAIASAHLPLPDCFICDVGTSIYERNSAGMFQLAEAYEEHQNQIIASLPIEELRQALSSIEGLRLQEREKQGQFKLSYYANADQLDDLVACIDTLLTKQQGPYSIISSVDPFNGDGLIDLLPKDVSKAHALAWWAEQQECPAEAIVFAGDSGNDLAAMTAGYRTIVVGNADRTIARQAYQAHQRAGWNNRLYFAAGHATSGVLEGCRWFGLIPLIESQCKQLASSIKAVGATPLGFDKTHFRVWAPRRKGVTLSLENAGNQWQHELQRDELGYFSATVSDAGPGKQYSFLLDEQQKPLPDPASRYQSAGVHGPSQVVNPQSFPWADHNYAGVAKQNLIIYELHVGTFTRGGTFQSAIERLPQLLELGITAVEVMPVAQSPGRWNWGYDGVGLYAVRNSYGSPDDFKAFVDACHAVGLAVLLDVVYNHLGPEGNYLSEFGPYFSGKHHTPWGDALNFDDDNSEHVRQFIVANAIHWLDEYHLDGLRLDAVHFMFDDSRPNILQEIREAVTTYARHNRRLIHLIAESNVYDRDLLTPAGDQAGYDGLWCDCLMHAIYSHALPDLKMTRRDYCGASDVAEALEHGYLYAGSQPVRSTSDSREKAMSDIGDDTQIASFVMALQTHDSVGNHPLGSRIHQITSIGFQKSAAALLLLYPGIPLIFMGEEVAVDAPFPFFVDFEDNKLRDIVDQAREKEFPHHVWQGALPPSSTEAFCRAICDDDATHNLDVFTWYRALIALRKRGVAEGWLSATRMTTGHDTEHDIFHVKYDNQDGGSVLIQARLASVSNSDAAPIAIPTQGTLILSSEEVKSSQSGLIEMQPNHALIFEL